MQLTLSVYVSVSREEGRNVYTCRPLRGPQVVTRDPLLTTALSKLAHHLRKQVHDWIEAGQAARVNTWLYDSETNYRTVKLNLRLRDRTLKWKLLMVTLPAFDRFCVFSPAISDTVFEIESMAELQQRASEVYSQWAQAVIAQGDAAMLDDIDEPGEKWVEPLEIEVERAVRFKKKSRDVLAALFGGGKLSGSEELHKVGQCLDEAAEEYELAVGREALVDEVDRLLARDDRQGVLLVGPPAVGKTAIIRDCVRRRLERFRSRRGARPQVWWLSPQRLISGMSYLGQWEQRWIAILREATRRDHVLYFDDLVGLFTAGRTRDSSLSAADVLRSYLSEYRVRILGETTGEQLAILRRRDRALADRFHLVHVPSLTASDALPVVLEAVQGIEARSGRVFHPECMPLVTRHQEIFAPDRAFPGKAIEMFKSLAKHETRAVNRHAFYRLAGTQSGASLQLLLNRLGNLESIRLSLAQRLIGQPGAVDALSRIVVRYAQHLQPPDRPLGVVLLLGPTGVGKTESAKALTRMLYNDESHLVRIDMNELTTPLAAEELVGTFDRPDGRLTAAVRRQPNCVILLDEIEKAHPDVFDYLLQVLGEWRLTDARGRVADFRSSIIIMTSNLGATEQTTSLGFEVTAERRGQIYIKSAQSFFRPEFFNRIDEVIAFRQLDVQDMRKIVDLQLDQLLSRDGIQRRELFVKVEPAAIQHVIRTGYDPQLGARAIRRTLEREVIGPLANCLSTMPSSQAGLVHVAEAPPPVPLQCRFVKLKVAQPHPPQRLLDLSAVVAAAEVLCARLNRELQALEPQLKQVDEQSGSRGYNAAYYSLREHVYRCDELRKAAAFRLTQRSAPRLDIAPQATVRSHELDGAHPKRRLRDKLTHEDLLSEVSGNSYEARQVSQASLARQLIDSLVVAGAMVGSALAPRNWLVGWEPLTGQELSADELPDERAALQKLGLDSAMFAGGASPFGMPCLLGCLRDHWQYEIGDYLLDNHFQWVSGISLIGVLGPLLGTYHGRRRGGANQLLVLRAIPVAPGLRAEQLNQQLRTSRLLAAEGQLRTPPEQPLPTDVVRGSWGERMVDYRSGASLDCPVDSLVDYDRWIARYLEWWMACLPVPAELLAAE